MKVNEAREAVLRAIGALSLDELRQPGRQQLYDAHQILFGFLVPFRLPTDVTAYLRTANALAIASIEAAIDKAIQEREVWVRTPLRRRRR